MHFSSVTILIPSDHVCQASSGCNDDVTVQAAEQTLPTKLTQPPIFQLLVRIVPFHLKRRSSSTLVPQAPRRHNVSATPFKVERDNSDKNRRRMDKKLENRRLSSASHFAHIITVSCF